MQAQFDEVKQNVPAFAANHQRKNMQRHSVSRYSNNSRAQTTSFVSEGLRSQYQQGENNNYKKDKLGKTMHDVLKSGHSQTRWNKEKSTNSKTLNSRLNSNRNTLVVERKDFEQLLPDNIMYQTLNLNQD